MLNEYDDYLENKSNLLYDHMVAAYSPSEFEFSSFPHENHSFFSFQIIGTAKSKKKVEETVEKTVEKLTFPISPEESSITRYSRKVECHPQTISDYNRCQVGTKDDTVELNINFKTIIHKYLKEFILLKELTNEEKQVVAEFAQKVPSFKAFSELFDSKNPHNHRIVLFCLELTSSPQMMKKIMSGRCQHKTKIQMIKYVEGLRKNILRRGEIRKWKEEKKQVIEQ